MGIPLLDGRFFLNTDNRTAPNVVIINQALAGSLYPNRSSLGRRFTFSFTPGEFFQIVGVVGDENSVALDSPVNPIIYFPFDQGGSRSMGLVLRTSADPSSIVNALRARIRDVDPTVAVAGIRTMEELIATSPYSFARRYPAMLIGLFAGIAVLLASIGVYGVVAYSVNQRTREIGVRLALGARRSDVFGLVLRQGAMLGAGGIALGLIASLAATRYMSNILFGVTATDPAIHAGVAVIFLGVIVLASYFPARHASRVDPLEALRES
jgi:predicted permease